jgi:predicted transcriptional regulator
LGNQLMGSETRARILAIVRDRRGLHKSHLMRLAGHGWGNIGHHIDVLVREGLVETQSIGRLLWIFDPETTGTDRALLVATRPTLAQRILHLIRTSGKCTILSIAEELDVSKKVVRAHLLRLQRAQAVIQVAGQSRGLAYSACMDTTRPG